MSELTHNEMLLCHAAAELMNGAQPDWSDIPKYLREEIRQRAEFLRKAGLVSD